VGVLERGATDRRDGYLVARRGCVACDPWLVFEGFTERARQVVVYAQEEVRGLGHDHIGTEHILLGLLRQQEGLAARVLEHLGVTVERVREQVVRIGGSGEEELTSGRIPFTPRAKWVLEMALREALGLGQNLINTEHILLGLVRENDDGVASRILLDLDVEPERIRNEVIRMVGAHRGQPGEGERTVPAVTGRGGATASVLSSAAVAPLMALAASQAHAHGSSEIKPVHVLDALTRDTQAAELLVELGVDVASLRASIERRLAEDPPPPGPAS
jgi:ATP-dependent Clp protease ATP-binding subunit ClpC